MESSLQAGAKVRASWPTSLLLFAHAYSSAFVFQIHLRQHIQSIDRSIGLPFTLFESTRADGSVYIWHRETGVLLEVLTGHGRGSVNSVAWNPQSERLFASCSDDWTIRIWEAPPPGYEGYSPSHNHSNSCEKSRRHTDPHDMLD